MNINFYFLEVRHDNSHDLSSSGFVSFYRAMSRDIDRWESKVEITEP